MKRFAVETLVILAACVALFVAYFLTERHFGGAGKWAFVAVAAIAAAGYLTLRRRK